MKITTFTSKTITQKTVNRGRFWMKRVTFNIFWHLKVKYFVVPKSELHISHNCCIPWELQLRGEFLKVVHTPECIASS